MEWKKIALIFPGQGSQVAGMGKALAEAYPEAGAIFAAADAALGYAISTLCFEGPEDKLTDTYYTQPALYTMGIAGLRALNALLGEEAKPAFMAGHSLGELTALAAAGAIPFEEGLMLVQERGRVMRDAGEQNPGAMAAVLGLDMNVIAEICDAASAETGTVVVAANDNNPGQVVISGEEAALERAMELAQERGARRAIKLAVSIASHSPLMEEAAKQFREAVDDAPISEPEVPVIGNVSATPLDSADAIREELSAQLVSRVRWTESVEAMITSGVETFVEIGPKATLTGMIRRIDRSAERVNISDPESLASFVKALKSD